MPSVRIAVWSCMRPGQSAPDHRVRPCPSLIVVVLMVFCFFFPEMKAVRPRRWACGRRTWVSVPSIRKVAASASA